MKRILYDKVIPVYSTNLQSIDRTRAKLTELYKLRTAALSERKRIEEEDQAYKDQLDKRRADM